MGLFNLHDGDAETRDDLRRMEIEADPRFHEFLMDFYSRVEALTYDQTANDRELEAERDL